MSPTFGAGGLTVALPPGWEGRLKRPATVAPLATPRPPARGMAPPALPRPLPYLHLANFALPSRRGTFGGGAVEAMGPTDVFMAIVEFPVECVGRPLFPRRGFPHHLRASQFHPHQLQHIIPGQAGLQTFFTASERAFSLYVVLGAYRRARALVQEVNAVLRGVRVGRAP